ncbi:unnamed protein product, partial [Heterosigma akashiwo]
GEKTVVVRRIDFLAGAEVAATGLVFAPHSVLADMSLPAAKQLYFCYIPRLNDGKSFYANDLKKAIDDQDWETVKKTFVKEVIVQPTSKKYNPPATSKWERDLTTPMTIWSSTFAEKGVSKKTTALQEQEQLLETALAKIERQKQIALESWEEGRTAINTYIEIANFGLSRELNKLEAI